MTTPADPAAAGSPMVCNNSVLAGVLLQEFSWRAPAWHAPGMLLGVTGIRYQGLYSFEEVQYPSSKSPIRKVAASALKNACRTASSIRERAQDRPVHGAAALCLPCIFYPASPVCHAQTGQLRERCPVLYRTGIPCIVDPARTACSRSCTGWHVQPVLTVSVNQVFLPTRICMPRPSYP